MMMWPHHTEVTGTFALLFTLTRVNIALLSLTSILFLARANLLASPLRHVTTANVYNRNLLFFTVFATEQTSMSNAFHSIK